METEDRRAVGPLVSAQWLAEQLESPGLRLADCRWYLHEPDRGRREDLSAPQGPGRHPLPAPETWAAHLDSMGFGDDHTVVVYDDRGGAVASRMWWMLWSIGHRSVAVLDGGLTAWRAGRGREATVSHAAPAAQLTVRSRPITVDAATLQERLGSVVLIDARDADRYRGEHEPIDPIAGHIPTALSLPLSGNLRADETFEDPSTLRRRYAGSGVGESGETVVYCGSGVTACHDILAMEIAGMPTAALYPGSWSDWSASNRPVAVGENPDSSNAG